MMDIFDRCPYSLTATTPFKYGRDSKGYSGIKNLIYGLLVRPDAGVVKTEANS